MKSNGCDIHLPVFPRLVAWGVLALIPWLTMGPAALAGSPNGAQLAAAVERAHKAGMEKDLIDRLLSDAYLRSLEQEQAVRFFDRLAALPGHLPRGVFVAKAEEGLSKHVAMDRILAALDRMQANFAAGSLILGSRLKLLPLHERALCLSIMAGSLELGLSRQAAGDLAHRFPGCAPLSLAVAAEIEALLGQIRFEAGLLDAIITAGMVGNRFDLSWRKLPGLVRLALQRGLPPAEIAGSTVAVLQQGMDIRALLPRLAFSRRNLVTGPAVE